MPIKSANSRRLGDSIFVIFGTVFAAATIALGFWQLSRLSERRVLNRELRSRAETKPVSLAELPSDTGDAHYRRVLLRGTYDFANEIVVTNRTRNGSPGVNILTPLRMAGTDTAVLVNRGWVYAADGMTTDLSKWREPAALTGDAFVDNYVHRDGQVRSPARRNTFRWMDYAAMSKALPYPLNPYYMVLIQSPGPQSATIPPRLDVPPLDEGPHMNYAFQWFSFASISIIGMFLFVRRK